MIYEGGQAETGSPRQGLSTPAYAGLANQFAAARDPGMQGWKYTT